MFYYSIAEISGKFNYLFQLRHLNSTMEASQVIFSLQKAFLKDDTLCILEQGS